MVESARFRYFDTRFFQFIFPVLIIKIAIYLIHLQIMDEFSPDIVTIKRGNSSATVHLFGATVTSWMPNGQEVLFLSKKSLFNEKKAIRGGIPVVFPHFGPWGNAPQHGFARITKWILKDGHKSNSDSVTLVLEDNAKTRQYWDYKFRFEYTVTVISDKQLKIDIHITNSGEEPFLFTFLLHNYFSIPDILSCKITGLKGCKYIDKVKNGNEFFEEREEVEISEFTDRIYKNTAIVHKIKHLSGNLEGNIEKFNLPDTVMWNPWSENAKSMSDFDDDEWKNMVCVEAGYVSAPVFLEPTKSFVASQILRVN